MLQTLRKNLEPFSFIISGRRDKLSHVLLYQKALISSIILNLILIILLNRSLLLIL